MLRDLVALVILAALLFVLVKHFVFVQPEVPTFILEPVKAVQPATGEVAG